MTSARGHTHTHARAVIEHEIDLKVRWQTISSCCCVNAVFFIERREKKKVILLYGVADKSYLRE